MSAAAVLIPRTAASAFVDAVRAELSKILTLPAARLTTGGTAALSALLAFFFASQAAESSGSLDSLDVAMAALPYAQAGLFVLGVVIATSEYVGGQIRTTLVAMPRRVAQRLAATVALVLVALPAALVTVLVTVGTSALVLDGRGAFPEAATVTRTIVSASFYLVLMVVFSAAIGFLTKRALPAAGALVLYLVVVSPMLLGQPLSVYLPDIVGYTLWFSTAPEGAPPAPVAWLIVLAWTLAALVPSIVVYRRRDV